MPLNLNYIDKLNILVFMFSNWNYLELMCILIREISNGPNNRGYHK